MYDKGSYSLEFAAFGSQGSGLGLGALGLATPLFIEERGVVSTSRLPHSR